MDQDRGPDGLLPGEGSGLPPERALRENPLSVQSLPEWSQPPGELGIQTETTMMMTGRVTDYYEDDIDHQSCQNNYLQSLICEVDLVNSRHVHPTFKIPSSTLWVFQLTQARAADQSR